MREKLPSTGRVSCPASRRSGLVVLWDIVVAPQAAFAEIRRNPTWLWAFVIVAALATLGAYLQVPAGEHVVTATFAHNAATDPTIAALSPAKQHQALQFALAAQRFAWLASPIIVIVAIAFSALLMLVANAIGGGDAGYRPLFALAANVAIVQYGFGALLIGLLVVRLGPDAFSSTRDIIGLLPSFARLAPEGATKLAVVLSAINPLSLWSCGLIAYGLRAVGGIRFPVAVGGAVVIAFGSTLIGAALAR